MQDEEQLGLIAQGQQRWRERWYGSDPMKGSAIVTESRDEVAVIGGDEETHKQVRKIVMAHNAALDEFARHQAERETLARMEPVAWMYEYRGGVVEVTATRYDRGTIKALGYVETPLYTLPPAPEAGQ